MEKQHLPPIINVKNMNSELIIKYFTCCNIFCKNCITIFNLITWVSLILIINYYKTKDDKEKDNLNILYFTFGAIFYCLYLIFECCSREYLFLKEKYNKIIHEKMGEIYKTNPNLCLSIDCYHYEKSRDWQTLVYTHKAKIKFDYKFCRDLSGIFNFDEKNYICKYYVY